MATENHTCAQITGICFATGVAGGALAGQMEATLLLTQTLNYAVSLRSIVTLLTAASLGYAVLGGLAMAVLGACACRALAISKNQSLWRYIPGALAGLLCAGIICLMFSNGPLKQRFFEAGLLLFPPGLCLAAGILLLVTRIIDSLRGRVAVLPGFLLVVFWLVFLVNAFWLIFAYAQGFQDTSLLVRILLTVLVGASLAVTVKSLASIWGSLRYGRCLNGKTLCMQLAVIAAVLIAAETAVDHFSVKKAGSPSPAAYLSENGALPNILWIVMDTVRADHLSCYGYPLPTTPFIDTLAHEGALFENAFSTSPWTLPSHASMFTGMYPTTHQTTNHHQFLSNRFTTIAELLRDNGYMTAGFSNNAWVSHMTNLSKGFDHFFQGFADYGTDNLWTDLYMSRVMFGLLNVEKKIKHLFVDWKSARHVNKQIDTWFEKKWLKDAPFFIFINYMEAHTPLNPPESFTGPFLPEGISFNKAIRVNQNNMMFYAGIADMQKRDFDCLRALYDGSIHYLDHRIAGLFDLLRSMHVLDNTIVIITSDHGENIGENGKMGHVFSVDDNLLHVPLIIRYPGKVAAGQRIARNVQVHQIFPTILDLAGIDWAGRDGLQVEGLFLESPPEDSTVAMALAELDIFFPGINMITQLNRNRFVDDIARTFKTIRDPRYKYIMASDNRDELYDKINDPGETKNVINEYPDRARELNMQLRALLDSFEIPDLKETDTSVADQATMNTLEALKSLGYAH